MDIPEKIMKIVERLEIEDNKRMDIRIQNRELERKRAEELEKLKESRRKELEVESKMIAYWIQSFFISPNGQRLFNIVGKIQIFTAPFWNGYPLSKKVVSEHATIFIDKLGNVTYSEKSKWYPSHDTPLGKIPLMPENLIKNLHPDFIKDFYEHLTSGVVWDYIEQAMSTKSI